MRTPPGEKRVSARRGRAGEKSDFFSILLGYTRFASQSTLHNLHQQEATMAIMCSLAVCKAQAGMCGHEKVMLSVAALAAIGLGAYFLIG